MDASPQLVEQLRREKIAAARRMTPEQRLAAGGDLFDAVVERMAAGVRMSFPNASPEEVMDEVRRRLEIARRLEDRV